MSTPVKVLANLKPIPPVEEGSVWTWNFEISCRDGSVIPKGSRAEVIERTGLTPHGEVMERGYNLLVHAANGTSVWASFEQCVSRDLLTRVR